MTTPEGIVPATRCQAKERGLSSRPCCYVADVVLTDGAGLSWHACKSPIHQLGAVLSVPYIEWYHAAGRGSFRARFEKKPLRYPPPPEQEGAA